MESIYNNRWMAFKEGERKGTPVYVYNYWKNLKTGVETVDISFVWGDTMTDVSLDVLEPATGIMQEFDRYQDAQRFAEVLQEIIHLKTGVWSKDNGKKWYICEIVPGSKFAYLEGYARGLNDRHPYDPDGE